ncbi:natural cytotoxicity triggering receptor 3-like [Paroedura picta]|uniref:natural cytotoxicity triggering receptor 3-like n=1 Tax=Paroedura picta TaxID=143630 RepID=UPI0040566D8B
MVFQPSSAQNLEGSSITLRCSYNSTSEPKVGSYQWVKDPGLVVKNSSPEFMGRVNFTSDQDFLLNRRADLKISDLRPSDSGLYRCVVNIHGLQETSGKGTELLIRRAQDLVVSQPSLAQGTEGGSITLRCSYLLPSEPKVGSYQWVKYPGLVVKNTSQEFTGRVNCTSDQGFLSEKRADIEIRDLRLNDSGLYHCVVNIHGLQETSGNGTGLQVTTAGELMEIQDVPVPQEPKWESVNRRVEVDPQMEPQRIMSTWCSSGLLCEVFFVPLGSPQLCW